MDLVQNLLIKIKKLSIDLVHDRGSMDPVHKSGPWTQSKEGVHGPLVHVLSSPRMNDLYQMYLFQPLLSIMLRINMFGYYYTKTLLRQPVM